MIVLTDMTELFSCVTQLTVTALQQISHQLLSPLKSFHSVSSVKLSYQMCLLQIWSPFVLSLRQKCFCYNSA